MNQFFFVGLLLFLSARLSAQKAEIDDQYIKNWEYSSPMVKVSENGRFLLTTYLRPEPNEDSVVLTDIKGKFISYFVGYRDIQFDEVGERLITLDKHSLLKIYSLKERVQWEYKNVDRFWIVGLKNTSTICFSTGGRLSRVDLDGKILFEKKSFDKVFYLSKRSMLIFDKDSLYLISDLQSYYSCIDVAGDISEVVTSVDQRFIAYLKAHTEFSELCIYAEGWKNSRTVVNKNELSKLGLDIGIEPGSLRVYNGGRVFFKISRNEESRYTKTNVNIWSSDVPWGSLMPVDEKNSPWYVYSVTSNKINLVSTDGEIIRNLSSQTMDKYALTIQSYRMDDYWWFDGAHQSVYLVDLDDGIKIPVLENIRNQLHNLNISPDDKFVIWFDDEKKQYFSFEIASKKTKCISADVEVPLYDKEADFIDLRLPFGIMGWGDGGVYVYDKFDIWKLSFGISEPARCITQGYGRSNNITFRSISTIPESDTPLYLVAFDWNTMNNGFFKLPMGKPPVKCSMSASVFYFPTVYGGNGGISFGHNPPLKLKYSKYYLVEREDSQNPRNYLLTADFINYTSLTHFRRPKGYRWYTSELIKWQLPDGNVSSGILYKPDDFDPTSSYPMIVEYYEKRSPELNKFIHPDYSIARINIPFYTSRNYLVFVPDIHYKTGANGSSVMESVSTAISYLSKFTWLDTCRIGIQGHSFGGFETNYLVTHSTRFAAACEVAGTSNLMAGYGQLVGLNVGGTRHIGYERAQGNIGCKLTDCPSRYIDNSPLFAVNKMETPLLIVHNPGDQSVLFSQAVELFMAGRKLGKEVYLLQYPEQGHVVLGDASRHFTYGMLEFFNYYLKSKTSKQTDWTEYFKY